MKKTIELSTEYAVMGALFELSTGAGAFLMVAPMITITMNYGVAREAVNRALAEIDTNGYYEWFRNDRHSNWPDRSLIIRRAKVTELQPTLAFNDLLEREHNRK